VIFAMLGYLIIGLLVVCALATGFAGCEHRRANIAEAATAQVRGEYAAFVEETRAKGEAAKRRAEEVETRHKEVSDATAKDHAAHLARLRAQYERGLRNAAPTRPDGSGVPITACRPGEPDAAATEPLPSVPLSEYLALEARAAEDALALSTLQGWLRDQGLAR
jgi:hypothetical protein